MSLVILYDSGAGHTKRLALCVEEGVRVHLQDCKVLCVSDLEATGWQILHGAEGLIFGSPTYMGGVSARFKAFMDASSLFWLDQPWSDKIAAGFTVGSSPSGDKLATLTSLSLFALQHGMVWVGQNKLGSLYEKNEQEINQAGSWLGLMATASRDKALLIDEGDARTARLFGARVAAAVLRWRLR
ncbi:MAG: flavodoxin family protein [Alphaproteobacteria bacterium]|jgi:NAD(P)H dehydrogenase (quinone)|nr:NAD(P)H-dependent oxidoreductase [Alphaproteobacteria bacterium]